jgi:hypothetical protein
MRIFKPFKKKEKINTNNLNRLNDEIRYTYTEPNLIKYYYNNNIFDKEVYILATLETIDFNIMPKIVHIEYNKENKSYINFDMTDLISLKSILENPKTNFYLIMNELVSFLLSIKNHKIFVYNLDIEHIYLNFEKLEFYILDLSETDFTNNCSNINFDSLILSLQTIKKCDKIIKFIESNIN